ncbi:MAG TPA: hypothetical protein VK254_04285 [Candidatus Bathyarchaeia archaeon]|nr:hypothetical protein [Candidatus Bathyarchaeia archaeon]
MPTEQKTQSSSDQKIAETAPAAAPLTVQPKKSNTAIWLLVGCLGIFLVIGLVVVGFSAWGIWKVKKEFDHSVKPEIENWQKTSENARNKADQLSHQVDSAVEQMQEVQDFDYVDENGNVQANGDGFLPPQTTEKAMGYIKKVYAKSGKNYLDIDYIQWLTGAEAEKAMREDGRCPKTGECIVYDDYYIRNQNPLIRTFEVSPDAAITMQTYSMRKTGQIQAEKLNFSQFKQIWTSSDFDLASLQDVPYSIEIGSNQIKNINEQYIP